MDQTTISCSIENSDPACRLGVEIWLDDICLLDQEHVTDPVSFSHSLPDDTADHALRFVLKNKPADYTTVDADGNILTDARLRISKIEFNQVELNYMVTQQAVYSHDFNGAGPPTQEKFYGEIGCNGTVSLRFTTPIYLWFLENM